jgi:hypothetical protein
MRGLKYNEKEAGEGRDNILPTSGRVQEIDEIDRV